ARPTAGSSPGRAAAPTAGPSKPAARSLRDNLGMGGGAPAPAAPPKRELPPEIEDEEEEEIEDTEEEEEEEQEYDEEGRFGTIAIVLGAVILCGLAFWLAMEFFSKQR